MTSPFAVGITTLPWVDPARTADSGTGPRPLTTELWYPAASGSAETEQILGAPVAPLFRCGRAARDAALAPGLHSCPLLLLSHGMGGAALQFGWLARALAAQGWLVAGVNHHGCTSLEAYTPQGFLRWWERATDLSVLLDQLVAHPTFGPVIDRERIAAAGFSLGGYAVLVLGGGRTDLRAFASTDPAADIERIVPPEFRNRSTLVAHYEALLAHDTSHQRSYHDPRIGALIALAPAFGEAFPPENLAPITAPTLIVIGEADTITRPEPNAAHFARHVPRAELLRLPAPIGHYIFIAEPTPLLRELAPQVATEPPGTDRAQIHRTITDRVVAFLATVG